MRLITRFASACRNKGPLQALGDAVGYLVYRYREYQVRRWYRKAHALNQDFDRRYGVDTFPLVDVADLDVDDATKSESNRFQSIYEHLFEEAIGHVKIDHAAYTFVDFGSGKGKAMMLASLYPFKKIVGVEFSSELCRLCERNLAVFADARQKTKAFEVHCLDARKYELVTEPSVFFFFNPFRAPLMNSVLERIAESIRAHPHPVWIIYCNPEFAACIDAFPVFEPVASARRFRVWRTRRAPGA